LIYKGIFILLANIAICAILVLVYILDNGLGQAVSMVVAGLIIGSMFTVVAWFINHSQMNYLEKRNLLVLLYVILSIAIFGLAASVANGSIFKLHKIGDLGFFSLAFTGGIFGLMMGCGLLFDYALLKTSASRLALLVSLLCFSMILIWYFPTDGLLLVISVVITRITFSIFMNRVLIDKISEQVVILGFFILSFTFIVLPLTAFLSR
jgi:hypothetical protein